MTTITVPGAHQSPVWPFAFALDWSGANVTKPAAFALIAIAAIALATLGLIITGVRGRFARLWIPGSVTLLVCAAASTWVLAVPAFPTTYATSPIPYTADAVARGAARFAQRCGSCHGPEGRGDGPAAAVLPVKPVNLAEHAMHHPQGNLFWWIAHGIPHAPMPAFSPQISDTGIWELVQYLAARSSAEAALSLGASPDANSMSRMPDFTYEAPGHGQRTLSGQRSPALIIMYSAPQSLPRLAELASDHRVLHGNLRVIAIPFAPTGPADDAGPLAQMVVDRNVASVYAMFATPANGSPPAHAELLVDASGVLRARWIGLPANGADRDAEIVAAAQHLPAPSSRMPAEMHHGN
ncbi:MAG: c-type cytochrome [Burkholderiales bacterium]